MGLLAKISRKFTKSLHPTKRNNSLKYEEGTANKQINFDLEHRME